MVRSERISLSSSARAPTTVTIMRPMAVEVSKPSDVLANTTPASWHFVMKAWSRPTFRADRLI